ncbi:MAG: glycosyltransferase family 39 protein [Rhodospirillales bacterium]|nr:glycosyltransferase family 39 protein [Rhodospirillales bacterium]
MASEKRASESRASGGRRWIGALLATLALAVPIGWAGSAVRWHDWPIEPARLRLILGEVLACWLALVALRLTRRAAPEQDLAPLLRPAWWIAGLIAVAMLIATMLFHSFPNSADEFGFLFESSTFLKGRLVNPPPPDPHLVAQMYLIVRDGKWVSQYLPGWPAILAAVRLIGLPAGLAAGLCGAVLLALVWRAARREAQSSAIATLAAVALGSSPFFLLNAASLFSHAASATGVMAAVYGQIRLREGDDRWALLVGAGIGAAALCRLDSALVAGLPLFAAWIAGGCRWRQALFGFLGVAPPLLALGLYNHAVTGSAGVPPAIWAGITHLTAAGFGGAEADHDFLGKAGKLAFQRLANLADTATLIVPGLYVWALVRRLRRRRLRSYDVIPLLNIALFTVFTDSGGWQLGPRYWFDGFVVMHLTVAAELATLRPRPRNWAAAALALLVPAHMAMLPWQAQFFARVYVERSAAFRAAAALPADGQRAFVLIGDYASVFNPRYRLASTNPSFDMMHNDPDLAGRVIYMHADVPDALARGCRMLPGARAYRFELNRAWPDGHLLPLACP